MAKNTVKVETDQLRACANNYKTYAQQYNDDWQVIESKLNECKNYWQGSFASDFEEVLKKVNKTKSYIYDNTIELANFMTQAADLYDKYNGDIARALREDTSKKANDYPDNVVPSVHIKTQEELSKIYSEATSIASKGTRNVGGGISCAEMTKAKMKLNGFDMERIGNGNETYYNINSNDKFNADKFPGANCLYDMLNVTGQPVTDIVISFPYAASKGNKKYGHVIYIDQIVDGKVYYSDNWVGTDGIDRKKGMVCTVEELLANYKRYGNGDPIGCIHLTKKR